MDLPMDLPMLYRSVVEDTADPIWVLDLEGHVIYGNRAMADLVGVERPALTDMTVFDVLDEEGRGHARFFLEEIRSGHRVTGEGESLIHDRQGRPHWVLMRQHLLRDDEGRVTGIVHRLSDHEERRAAHLELSRSQDRLREVQAIARIKEWRWSTRGHRNEINEVVDALHPRDRARATLVLAEAVEHAQRHGQTGSLQLDVREPAASGARWWRMRAVAQLGPDGVVEFIGSQQDISEIKETERALRRESDLNALLRRVASAANETDSLHEALHRLHRLDRPFDQWASAHILAVEREDGLVLVASTQDADPLTPQGQAMAERASRTRRPEWAEDDLTVAFPVVHGEQVQAVGVLSRGVPHDSRSQVEQMLGDIALQLERVVEREEAQRQLAQARDQAMEASRQKSKFMATMSHEIRTPLNGILGLNELLLDSSLEPEQRRLVIGAQAAGRVLLRLINEVLDFSEIEAAGPRLEDVPFDVTGLLDQVIRLGETTRQPGVTLGGTCHPDVPPVLVGDPTKLGQVIGNLLANALKFTEAGAVEVSLSMADPDAAADGAEPGDGVRRLRCEVSDTGIGIEPSRVEELFEPFVQGDTATTRRFGGTGLGLAIARDIVTALGGTLTHRPRPGGGSVFTFDVACTAADPSVTVADIRAGVSLAGRRLLLVTDDADRRTTWSAAVDRWRMCPVEAEPEQAVARLRGTDADRESFDVVLIDLERAEEGLALAQAVAAVEELDDVVMVLLGDGSLEADRVLEAGVSTSLARPVTVPEVRAALLEQVAGVSPPARARATSAPTRRVLVVEDNEANQLVAITLLASIGFAHDVAGDGVQALELMEHTAYDAVLMDVQMPVLDGYDTTRALREREAGAGSARLPVVAITASAVQGERDRCLAAGMDDFLTKPVDLGALTRTLHRWVGLGDAPLTTGEVELARTPPTETPEGSPVGPDGPPALDPGRLAMLGDLDLEGEAYLARAIANFTRNSVEAVDRIRVLLGSGRPATAAPVAHKIAGSALNLGCLRAGELARAFELACEVLPPGRPHGLDAQVAALDAAMAEARDLLADYHRVHAHAAG